jgi:hypothetical protein
MSEIVIDVERIILTGDVTAPEATALSASVQTEITQMLQHADWANVMTRSDIQFVVIPRSLSLASDGNLAHNIARSVTQALNGTPAMNPNRV